jgi:hypothetical protein
MSGGRARRAASLALLAVVCAASSRARAGALSGPILDVGITAELVDVVQLPATAASGARARINGLHQAPDGSGRLFVNDLRGPLYVISGATATTYLNLAALRPALKISPGLASGFNSFVFHPGFATNGIFYTVHTEFVGSVPPTHSPAVSAPIVQHSVLTEWRATNPAANTWSGTTRELIRVAAPHHNHNMGELTFNPNALPGQQRYGWLYISNGDYGSALRGQPQQLQRLDTVYGAILRIDPLGGTGAPYSYGIPVFNPFANDGNPATLGEIFAYGFRNAHRLTWSATGLGGPFISELGEANLEEVDVLQGGANYGWPYREGNRAIAPQNLAAVFALPANDAIRGFTYPAAQYDHDEGSAIAGGVLVEGGASAASRLNGAFVFGDIVNGRVFYAYASALDGAHDGDPGSTAFVYELTLTRSGVPTTLLEVVRTAAGVPGLARTDLRLAADPSGNLYITTKQDGWLRRLVLAPAGAIPALSGWMALGLVCALAAIGSLSARQR